MSLPVVPNRSGDDERDLAALYEYIGRMRSSLETRLASIEARIFDLENP